MREGGHVILLRHALTDYSKRDSGVLGDRARQRTLSARDKHKRGGLGRAFRALDIPVDRVLASPVFRASDTAALAFGVEGARH